MTAPNVPAGEEILPSTRCVQLKDAHAMSKTLLYSLVAIVDIVIAILAYRSGRIVIPAILVIAGIFFAIAAIGTARGSGVPK